MGLQLKDAPARTGAHGPASPPARPALSLPRSGTSGASLSELDVVDPDLAGALGADCNPYDIREVDSGVIHSEVPEWNAHAGELRLVLAAAAPPAAPLIWMWDRVELIRAEVPQCGMAAPVLEVDE